MSEQNLISYCSPTLAGLKTGSLFNCRYNRLPELEEQVEQYNRKLNGKGVQVKILKVWQDIRKALVYVYRPALVGKDMSVPETGEFLRTLGYEPEKGIDGMLGHLTARILGEEEFPHEIGLFLSYPLPDVLGFIRNQGQNYKCVGTWKVYSEENEAAKRFRCFEKCRTIYTQRLKEGVPLEKLTVRA